MFQFVSFSIYFMVGTSVVATGTEGCVALYNKESIKDQTTAYISNSKSQFSLVSPKLQEYLVVDQNKQDQEIAKETATLTQLKNQ